LSINTSSGLVNLSLSTIGTYTVTYSLGGTCPSSSTQVITITDVPVAAFSYAGPYCKNASNPSPTYQNNGSAGTFSASPTGLVFTNLIPGEVDISASTVGTYTITNSIAGGAGGCSAVSADTTITINPVPVTNVDTKTICAGDPPATLTANGATSYVWSDASTLGTLTASPATTTSYTVTGTSAGCSSTNVGKITVNPIPVTTVNSGTVCAGLPATLTASGAAAYSWSTGSAAGSLTLSPATTTSYTVTGTSLGCSSSAIATITVNQIPVVTVNSVLICQGDPATLTASGANSYSWSNGSAVNPITVSPATTTSYTVTGTTAGCSSTNVGTITVNPIPTSPFSVTPACVGAASTITYTGNAPANATYNWNFVGSGGTVLSGGPGQGPYTVSWATGGSKNVTLSVALGTCISPVTTVAVTVNPPPAVIANTATICAGKSTTLTAGGASTYLWSNGSTVNPLAVSPTTTTTYTVVGTDVNGCTGTATTTVIVNQNPVVTANIVPICPGFSATLTASGAVSYVWSNGGIGVSLTDSPPNTTSYIVTGTDANGCSSTGLGTITVFHQPQAQFSTAPDVPTVSYPTITFTNQSTPDVNYWFWNFGNGDTLAPNTASPVYTYPPVDSTYIVTLTVHNAGGCVSSITRPVRIWPEFSFFIPNAFTPNDDKINDVFGGSGGGIIQFQLLIFDRWGNQIFSADDISKTWDGRANGGSEVVQQDVYVWKVKLTDVFKKEHNYIGTVTIVKGQ